MEKSIEQDRKVSTLVRKNIILFLIGRFTSLIGTNIYSFALSLYILKTTNSAKLFSISLFITMITKIVFSSVAGIISDNYNRKTIVILTDILSGLTVIGFLALVSLDSIRVSYIFIATFLLSLFNTIFDVGIVAAIPNLVDDENITRINALNSSVQSFTQIISPVLAGIVYSLIDIRFFLLINGVSFILSAIVELFIDFDVNKASSGPRNENRSEKQVKRGFLSQLLEGVNYIKNHSVLKNIILYALSMNFFIQFGLVVSLPFIINKTLGLSEGQYGIIQGGFALGMMIGSIALSALPEKKRHYKQIRTASVIFSIFFILLGLILLPGFMKFSNTIYFIYYFIIYFLMAFTMPMINIPLFVILQKRVEDSMRGRVFGLLNSFAGSIAPLGILLSGVLIDLIPIYILPVLSGIALLVVVSLIFSRNELKEI